MNKLKKQYYQLDDLHELSNNSVYRKNSEVEKNTRQFFASRRKKAKPVKKKNVSV